MDIFALALFVGHFPALLADAPLQSTVLLYLGPETIMPVGSFLAAALGIFLIFWRQTLAIARNSFRRVFVRKPGYSKFGSEMNIDDPGQDGTPDRAN
jgi:hypothetical protein